MCGIRSKIKESMSLPVLSVIGSIETRLLYLRLETIVVKISREIQGILKQDVYNLYRDVSTKKRTTQRPVYGVKDTVDLG